ncbi:hypothetical protein Tco_1286431 [Tanacetum coccineum]
MYGAPGWLTIPVDFFFNKDLEYLSSGNVEKRYVTSLTKLKAARYDLEGIEQMIQMLWSSSKVAYDKDVVFGMSYWDPKENNSTEQDKLLFLVTKYGYLKEIVVRRANQQEFTFKEADFMRLNLNDIEDRSSYLNKDNKKFLMRADELYKFGDGTLKKVHDELDYMLKNFKLGYNKAMPRSVWTDKDKRWTTSMLEKIEYTLLTRRIMMSLECYMGRRNIKTDYRLLTRT